MRDWKRFYEDRVAGLEKTDYLKQVGHTLRGEPIGAAETDSLVETMLDALKPDRQDTLLDLCCGNGYFTARLADRFARVAGVDLSPSLIEIARSAHRPANTVYIAGNALEISPATVPGSPFSKIQCFAALQHFEHRQFRPLLARIRSLASPDFTLFFGFVPDAARAHNFYSTPRWRWERRIRRLFRRDPVGSWWSKGDIEAACRAEGLCATFHDLPSRLHAASYRFNIVIRPQA